MRMVSPVDSENAPCARQALRPAENAQKTRPTRNLFVQSRGTIVWRLSFTTLVKARVRQSEIAAQLRQRGKRSAVRKGTMLDRTKPSETAGGLCGYAHRPFAFIFRYVRLRAACHAMIVAAVLAAVACSVTTQYGVKYLVDQLASGPSTSHAIWFAFALLVGLIAADNLLWRVAGWFASFTFVRVTGDLRRDLFRHLTGHSPSYFAERMPGTLTSRVTATSNAVFTLQNMSVWNVLPPCVATVVAIGFVVTVSLPMAAALMVLSAILVLAMFRLAAAGRPLHHEFADRAAAVDGEMVDVVGNMSLVWSFCALGREHRRLDATIDREMTARRRSLLYLEKLRLLHAGVTVFLTIGLLGWAIVLWQNGAATTGDVVLVCTLGLSILHATRDLAVALVDVTQHLARLSEALGTLLIPHHLQDHPKAT